MVPHLRVGPSPPPTHAQGATIWQDLGQRGDTRAPKHVSLAQHWLPGCH